MKKLRNFTFHIVEIVHSNKILKRFREIGKLQYRHTLILETFFREINVLHDLYWRKSPFHGIFSKSHESKIATLWKNEKFSLTQKKFRQSPM